MKTNLTRIVIIVCLALAVLSLVMALVMATTDEASANDATDDAPSQATITCRWPLQPKFFTRSNGTRGARCGFVWSPG